MFRLEELQFDLGYGFITRQISLLKDPSQPRLCYVEEFQNIHKDGNRGYLAKFLRKMSTIIFLGREGLLKNKENITRLYLTPRTY